MRARRPAHASHDAPDVRVATIAFHAAEGWAYATPKLKRDLTLTTQGSATVIQDELQNTYQRRP
jgi:hypothetical protein